MTTVSSKRRQLVFGALGIGLLVCFWGLLARNSSDLQIPAPTTVLETIRDNFVDIPAISYIVFQDIGLASGLLYTLTNVILGVAIGASIGFVLGLLLARIDILRHTVEPVLIIFGTIPILIVLPFLLLWFGTSRIAQAGLVIFYSLLTVTFVTQNAAGNIAGTYEQFALSLGASKRTIMRRIIVPASLPEVLGGVRAALAAGWGFEAIAEVLGAQHGAGRIIQVFGTLDATPDIIGVVLCIAVLGVAIDACVVVGSKSIIRWQE